MNHCPFSAIVLCVIIMVIPGHTGYPAFEFESCNFERIGIIHKERESGLIRENIVTFDLVRLRFEGKSKILIESELEKLKNQLSALNWLSFGARFMGKGEIYWSRRICGNSSGFGYALWFEGLPVWYYEVEDVP